MRKLSVMAVFVSLVVLLFGIGLTRTSASDMRDMGSVQQRLYVKFLPSVPKLEYSLYRTAPIEVARVFGRVPACAEADSEFIELVARQAVDASVDARLLAALVAVESSCNQFAISSRGAIGYTQIMPKVWNEKYDFTRRYNLLNARDNLHVGGLILSDLVWTHGVWEGVRRYQGTGQGCNTCDPSYTAKILNLAGRR